MRKNSHKNPLKKVIRRNKLIEQILYTVDIARR